MSARAGLQEQHNIHSCADAVSVQHGIAASTCYCKQRSSPMEGRALMEQQCSPTLQGPPTPVAGRSGVVRDARLVTARPCG
jgi:hypothetical protein